jgi:hypothetical protein
LACQTQEQIAEAVGLSQPAVVNAIEELSVLESFPKLIKLQARYEEADWTPPVGVVSLMAGSISP